MANVEAGVATVNSVTGEASVAVRGQEWSSQPVAGLQGVAEGQDVTLLRFGRGFLALPSAGYYAPRS